MGFLRKFRALFAILFSLIVISQPAHALVNIDDGRNQVFVSASFNAGYDSNLFGNSEGGGDSSYGVSLSSQFVRRAGWIGLNASVGVNATRYGKYTSENFQNPTFSAEFTKQGGRTTGALTLSAARQSRADTAANIRSESWNYNTGLNFKYPVIERYSFSGTLGYALTDYVDNSVLVDLKSYTFGLDLYYVFTTERDLIAGYKFRRDETSASTQTSDHSFTVGMTGKLISSLTGSIRGGYSYRIPHGHTDGAATYSAWTANTSATWHFTKRFSVTGLLGKDFSTTSTNISVNTITSSVNTQYALNTKTSLNGGVSWGLTDYLGELGGGRRDTNWGWNAGINRTFNDHLKCSLSYNYFRIPPPTNFQNSSAVRLISAPVPFSNFSRHEIVGHILRSPRPAMGCIGLLRFGSFRPNAPDRLFSVGPGSSAKKRGRLHVDANGSVEHQYLSGRRSQRYHPSGLSGSRKLGQVEC